MMREMKTDIQIANEVMQGKWGVGKDREMKLKTAGYDYNIIQGYVNRMMLTGKPIKEITINAGEVSGIVINIGI